MRISLIQAPYWLGNPDVPLAEGPARIVDAGAVAALREAGHDVHLDLDVVDRSEGVVNHYATEGGPSAAEVVSAIRAVGERFRIRSAALTAYVPGADPGGRVPPIAVRLLVQIADAAARRAVAA